ncbi:hypothetical protein KKE26_02585 [bacterium]|nr:hypothetical protein [bacterium]
MWLPSEAPNFYQQGTVIWADTQVCPYITYHCQRDTCIRCVISVGADLCVCPDKLMPQSGAFSDEI